jgi:molecular chaperone HscC
MVCVGIDLGTTNSLIAVYEEDGPRLLRNAIGDFLTPSVVGLADDKSTFLVGKTAQKRLIRRPDLTKALFKRQMGSGTSFKLGRKYFNATELSAMVLSSLKKDAEAELNCAISEAVISVPAYFNAIQRQATKDAAEIAGLKIRRLINEPTAAALASGVLERAEESLFLVLDLGGGTFDVSILEMFEGVMEVRSSAGDSFLGGEDFTMSIARHFSEQAGLSWSSAKPEEKEILLSFAERIKCSLTNSETAKADLELNGKTHHFSLSVQKFEELTATLLGRLRRPIEKCLYDSGVNTTEIERVILVGGATRMPVMRSMAARIFKKLPERNIDPDHAIALGAAVQAGLIDKHQGLKDVVMTDVSPFSMGIETNDERGQSTIQGAFAPIIERNTILPASRRQYFSTLVDNQKQLQVAIYQGEAALARDNVFLGSLMVPVPPKPAGEEYIDVRFTYDVSGLLVVDVTVPSTKQSFSEIVDHLAEAMSKSEKEARLRDMEKIKVNPRDTEANTALMESIKHLHEMLLGRDREYVMGLLGRFEAALDTQDTRQIESERSEIAEILAQIEAGYVT